MIQVLCQLSYPPPEVARCSFARPPRTDAIGPTWIRTKVSPVMSRPLWTAELWAQREARMRRSAIERVFLSPAVRGVKATSAPRRGPVRSRYNSSVYALSRRLRVG